MNSKIAPESPPRVPDPKKVGKKSDYLYPTFVPSTLPANEKAYAPFPPSLTIPSA